MPPRVRLMILRACGPEHQAYCANVPVGGGRIVDCLAANGASLSPQFRDAILSAK
ncbi:MAG TPA: cysteine rich repeat-containing protein [Xanthobacteraceae bacterium]